MPHVRWLIIGLVFLATVINYLDRLTISVLAPVITKELQPVESRIRAGRRVVPGGLHDQPGALGPALRSHRLEARLHGVGHRLVLGGRRHRDGDARWARSVRAGSCSDSARRATGRARRRWWPNGSRCASAPSRWRSSTAARRSARSSRRRSSSGCSCATDGRRRSSSPRASASCGWCCGCSSTIRPIAIR